MDKALLSEVGGPSPEALGRLIYVVGSARGGSSITQAIIALHDDVIAMNGPTSFLNHVWRYRNRIHDRLWRQLLWTPGYLRRAAVRDSLPEKRKQAFIKLVNTASAEKKLGDLYRLYPLVKALDPDEERDPCAFRAWLDKGNDFWGVDRLPEAFPEARFVFVVRDPRGAVASLAKRFADQRPDTEFEIEPVDVITSAIYWRNLAWRQLRFARRNPGKAIFFRFEDLTANPVRMAQSLYETLGLPALPEAELKRRLDRLVYSASVDTERGAGISTAPNERWKAKLDQVSRDLVSEICGSTADAFGYDLPEPVRRSGLSGIVSSVPGGKAKVITAAKLVYLNARGQRTGASGHALALERVGAE